MSRYQREFGAPFLHAQNGEVLWFHDVRHVLNRARQVSGFHTPLALNEMLTRDFDAELVQLGAIPLNERIRPYRREANEAVEQAIRDRKRKLPVTMATGTRKTLMTVHGIYWLMMSGVARRVLFLVDRRALAAQTLRAIASSEAEPGLKLDELYSQRFQRRDFEDEKGFDPKVIPTGYLTNPQPGHRVGRNRGCVRTAWPRGSRHGSPTGHVRSA